MCGGRTEGLALKSAGTASRILGTGSLASSFLELLLGLLRLLDRVLLARFLSLLPLLRVLLLLREGGSGSRRCPFDELVCLPSSSTSAGLLSLWSGDLVSSSSRLGATHDLSCRSSTSSPSVLPGAGDVVEAGLFALGAVVLPASSCKRRCSWCLSASSCRMLVQILRLVKAQPRRDTGSSSKMNQKRFLVRQKAHKTSCSPHRSPQSLQTIGCEPNSMAKSESNTVVLISGGVTSYISLRLSSGSDLQGLDRTWFFTEKNRKNQKKHRKTQKNTEKHRKTQKTTEKNRKQ